MILHHPKLLLHAVDAVYNAVYYVLCHYLILYFGCFLLLAGASSLNKVMSAPLPVDARGCRWGHGEPRHTNYFSSRPLLSPRLLLILGVYVYFSVRTKALLKLMALPANDAFSLSHDPTRPPYSLSLRPTSPKMPFMSAHTRTTATTYNIPPRKTVRTSSRRSMSNGRADGHAAYETLDVVPPAQQTPRVETSRRTSSKASVPAVKPSSPPAPPIDWEIPRKILHSSIGGSRFVFVMRLHSSFRHAQGFSHCTCISRMGHPDRLSSCSAWRWRS
jgi:hypothetical protein